MGARRDFGRIGDWELTLARTAYVVGVPDQAKRNCRSRGRTALRRGNRYRFDHRVLPRAVGKLQGFDPSRFSNGGTAPTNADRQNP
jgi:hypothetical protein